MADFHPDFGLTSLSPRNPSLIEDVKRSGHDPRKIALEVLERIETFPETYNQRTYANSTSPSSYDYDADIFGGIYDIWKWSDCGTTACVAGHTIIVGKEMGIIPMDTSIHHNDAARLGRDLLKLSNVEAACLFSATAPQSYVKDSLRKIGAGKE